MALQPGKIALRFGGLNRKQDPLVVPPTQLLGCENALFAKAGTIQKRTGYDALPRTVLGSTEEYGTPRGLAARGRELLLFAADRAYSYVSGPNAWSQGEVVQSVMQADRPLVKSGSAQLKGDYAAANGVGLCGWEDSRGGVYFAVVADDDDGQVIQGPALIDVNGVRPRCVEAGGNLILLWVKGGIVYCLLIDPTAPNSYDTSQFPRALLDDLVAAVPNYDACTVAATADTAAAAAITWYSTTGIRVGWLTSSGLLGSPAAGWPSVLTVPIVIAGGNAFVAGPVIASAPWSPTKWGITYAMQTNAYAFEVDGYDESPLPATVSQVYSPVALAVASATNVANAWRKTATVDRLDSWLEQRAGLARNGVVIRKVVDTSGVQVETYSETRGVCLASKGWSDPLDGVAATSRSYVTLVHDVPLFGVYLTLRHDGFCVARTLPGLAGHPVPKTKPHLPSVIGDGVRAYRWTATYKTQLEAVNLDAYTEEGLRLITLDFDDAAAFQTAIAGRSLYMGGACPLIYDGQGWFEHQPHYAPDWEAGETLHINGNDLGALTNGVRAYIFTYDYTLATGDLVRGAASKPYVVETTGTNTTVFSLPTLRVTRMSSEIPSPSGRVDAHISVWRTIAGDASVYYRVSSNVPPEYAGGGGGGYVPGDNDYVGNSTTDDAVGFTDKMSDDVLITKEPLYTNGGILSNDPPAATGVLAGGKNRLFSTDPSDGSAVRYSQSRGDGYAIEWPADLVMSLDPAGGDVTAIGILDDAVVIFKRSAIYTVAGPGPLSDPQAGGGWTEPVLVTSDVGCLSQRSLATTPNGLVFQSAKGIYLIDRSQQVNYIGALVEGFNAQTITRANLIEDTTSIRFLTDDGSTLHWDYREGQWSTFTNHEGIDACLVGGAYHYLRNDGRVFKQAVSYSDAGTQIRLNLETAWIHLQEHLQGFQRIWWLHILGTWKSAHTLRIQYRTDYQVGWSPPLDVDMQSMGGTGYGDGLYGAGPYGGARPEVYRARFHISAKGSAVQFRVCDVEGTGLSGASFELTEFLLEGGVKGNVNKRAATRSA